MSLLGRTVALGLEFIAGVDFQASAQHDVQDGMFIAVRGALDRNVKMPSLQYCSPNYM